jgi:hypothetical protein
MKTQSSLIGTKCAGELDPVTNIGLDLAFVIYPGNSEANCPFWLDYSLILYIFHTPGGHLNNL